MDKKQQVGNGEVVGGKDRGYCEGGEMSDERDDGRSDGKPSN